MSVTLITAGIGLVTSLFSSWSENKKAKAAGKIKITAAKLDATVKQIAAKQTMDAAAAGDMRFSWKDEYFVVILSLPYLMSFIPGLDQVALEGFDILARTPDWYRYSFLGVIAATFGLRTWFNNFKK